MESICMDTHRRDPFGPAVECTAHIMIGDEDVMLSVLAFGNGREGTDKAFEKMENALDALGFEEREKVRVY
jgi:hypothetical protein